MPKGEKRNEVSRSAAKGERSPFSRFSDHLACEIFLGALGNSQGATNFPCDAANESESVGFGWRFHLGRFSIWPEREHHSVSPFFGQKCGPTCCLATRPKARNW